MYSISQIQELQRNQAYFEDENEKYCLVSLQNKELNYKDVENQCNFCILRIINDYKRGLLSSQDANSLINKIETFEYMKDFLGPLKTIHKLNSEVVQEGLHLPFFNQLCVVCSDLYDIVK